MKKLTTGNGHFCVQFNNHCVTHRRISIGFRGQQCVYTTHARLRELFLCIDGSLGYPVLSDEDFIKESQPLLEEWV
jgi:hypothetical protein